MPDSRHDITTTPRVRLPGVWCVGAGHRVTHLYVNGALAATVRQERGVYLWWLADQDARGEAADLKAAQRAIRRALRVRGQ